MGLVWAPTTQGTRPSERGVVYCDPSVTAVGMYHVVLRYVQVSAQFPFLTQDHQV